MPAVRDVGEFGLIRRLARKLGPVRADVVVGIGDDVAVVSARPDRYLLATCDVQVEGVHFVPGRVDPHRLGRKAAAVNLSDIAAAGGRPTHALVSLLVPPEMDVSFLEALYEGIAAEMGRFGGDVIGGNMARLERLVVDVTLLGEADGAHLVRRAGARPGDLVLVTGRLGAAAAGLHVAREPSLVLASADRAALLDAYETPTPRLAESAAMVRAGGVTAMIDVSDGLAADLGHVCEESGVGVRVFADQIPIDGATRRAAAAAGVDPLRWALGGGEDYELLLTADPQRAEALVEAVEEAAGTRVSIIGQVTQASSGRFLVATGGQELPLASDGWAHF